MQQVTEIAQNFKELGLSQPLLEAVAKLGWERPTEVQACLIPHALARRDVLGQARTGTGKTGAFALPILQPARGCARNPGCALFGAHAHAGTGGAGGG